MLLNLIVHQPQALAQIVQQTPTWVWGLLAALLGLGASQLFDRTAGLRRVLFMPAAMTGFSAYGLASAFASSSQAGAAVGAWLVAAAAAAALALWFQPKAPAGARYDSAARRFHLYRPTPRLAIELFKTQLCTCLDPGHPTLDLLLLHGPTDFIDSGQNPSSTAGRGFRDTL